jgi:hypothetical protein
VSRLTNLELADWAYRLRYACRKYKLKMKGSSQPFKVNGLDDDRIKALKEIGFWDQA